MESDYQMLSGCPSEICEDRKKRLIAREIEGPESTGPGSRLIWMSKTWKNLRIALGPLRYNPGGGTHFRDEWPRRLLLILLVSILSTNPSCLRLHFPACLAAR